jgi:hypothetical protein
MYKMVAAMSTLARANVLAGVPKNTTFLLFHTKYAKLEKDATATKLVTKPLISLNMMPSAWFCEKTAAQPIIILNIDRMPIINEYVLYNLIPDFKNNQYSNTNSALQNMVMNCPCNCIGMVSDTNVRVIPMNK